MKHNTRIISNINILNFQSTPQDNNKLKTGFVSKTIPSFLLFDSFLKYVVYILTSYFFLIADCQFHYILSDDVFFLSDTVTINIKILKAKYHGTFLIFITQPF